MSQQSGVCPEDIPKLIKETLVNEYGEDQDRCVRGYFPSQSIHKVMEFLDPEQIQQLKGTRTNTDAEESFTRPQDDLPPYVETKEVLRQELVVDYDRAKHPDFEWDRICDFLVESGLQDIAIEKLVVKMDNPGLRDHLWTVLRKGIKYPPSQKGAFQSPFYFVMESQGPEVSKDYDNIEAAHDQGYLEQLRWNRRCLDLMAIWSHKAWTDSCQPFRDTTQREIEEFAFNQLESDEPVFGAVNSMLVVNRWRVPFGRGMTDVRHYEWEENQQGWVRRENGGDA